MIFPDAIRVTHSITCGCGASGKPGPALARVAGSGFGGGIRMARPSLYCFHSCNCREISSGPGLGIAYTDASLASESGIRVSGCEFSRASHKLSPRWAARMTILSFKRIRDLLVTSGTRMGKGLSSAWNTGIPGGARGMDTRESEAGGRQEGLGYRDCGAGSRGRPCGMGMRMISGIRIHAPGRFRNGRKSSDPGPG
jgi:hypothetical protein